MAAFAILLGTLVPLGKTRLVKIEPCVMFSTLGGW